MAAVAFRIAQSHFALSVLRMKIATGAMLLALAPVSGAAQQQPTLQAEVATPAKPDSQKAEIIRQIVKASDIPELRERMADLLMPAQNARVRLDPVFPAAYVVELRAKLQESVARFDVAQVLTAFYERNFSISELKDILAFRTSPTGRRFAGVEWELYGDMNAAISQWARDTAPVLNQEILAEHPEYAKQIEENKRSLRAGGGADVQPQGQSRYSGAVEHAGDAVSAPHLVSNAEPHYSKEARAAGLQGTVGLSVVIDEKGVPRDIRVVRSLGKGLDEKAIEAVEQWRFRPGMKNGAPVAVRTRIEINFRLPQFTAQ